MAEGARLEIVYTPKAYPGFKSQTLRQNSPVAPSGATFRYPIPHGGVAEWLNAAVSKTVYPLRGYEGSNPSSSAIRSFTGGTLVPPVFYRAREYRTL